MFNIFFMYMDRVSAINIYYYYYYSVFYSDIVTTIGKGNGSFLVLLDLSAAFDTIDHSNVFDILEKYVGITGDALQLIK